MAYQAGDLFKKIQSKSQPEKKQGIQQYQSGSLLQGIQKFKTDSDATLARFKTTPYDNAPGIKTTPQESRGVLPMGKMLARTNIDISSAYRQPQTSITTPSYMPSESVDRYATEKERMQAGAVLETNRGSGTEPLWEKTKRILFSPFMEDEKTLQEKDRMVRIISKETGTDPDEIYKDFRDVRKQYLKQKGSAAEPDVMDLAELGIAAMIAPAIVTVPVTTAALITGFMVADKGLREAINLAKSIAMGQKYEFGAIKDYNDILSEDANQVTKDLVDIVGFLVSAAAVGRGHKLIGNKMPAIMEKITKNVIEKYNLPRKMYINSKEVMSLFIDSKNISKQKAEILTNLGLDAAGYKHALKNGLEIELSAEKITTLVDKPYWTKLKKIFHVKPTQPITKRMSVDKPTVSETITRPERILPEGGVRPTAGVAPKTKKPTERVAPITSQPKKSVIVESATKKRGEAIERITISDSKLKDLKLQAEVLRTQNISQEKYLETIREDLRYGTPDQKRNAKITIKEFKEVGYTPETFYNTFVKSPEVKTPQRVATVKAIEAKTELHPKLKIKPTTQEARVRMRLLEQKPTYRGVSNSEWESIKTGNKISSKSVTGRDMGVAYVSETPKMAKGYGELQIEFKPEAIDKMSYQGELRGERKLWGRDLDINDIARITDKNGKVIFVSVREKYKSAEEFVKGQKKSGIEVRDKTGLKLQDPYTAEYLPVNKDGTITVYYSTTKEGANKIKQEGVFGSKTEGGDIYFTTNKNGYGGIGKGKDTILAFNIDPKKIKFDDVYRGELHLKGNNADIGGLKPVEIKTKSQLTAIDKDAFLSGGKYASVGEYAKPEKTDNVVKNAVQENINVDKVRRKIEKAVQQGKTKLVQMPELVGLYKELSDGAKLILKNLRPQTQGYFKPIINDYYIALNRKLFQLKEGQTEEESIHQIAMTMSHELGHLVDFIPEQIMKRGNILGRLYSIGYSFRKQIVGNPELMAKRKKIMQDISNIKGQIKKITESDIKRQKELEVSRLEVKFAEINEQLVMEKPFRDELWALSQRLRPISTNVSSNFLAYRKSAPELYADFLSAILNQPALAKKIAPKFSQHFWEELDRKPEFKRTFFELQSLLFGEQENLMKYRLDDVIKKFKKADKIFKYQLQEKYNTEQNWWYKFKKQMIYKHQWVVDMRKKTKATFEKYPDADPQLAMEELDYLGGLYYEYAMKHIAPANNLLKDNNIFPAEVSALLFFERIGKGNTREGIANPFGYDKITSGEVLDFIGKHYEGKKKEIIYKVATDLRNSLIDKMLEYPDLFNAEIITELKTLKKNEKSNFYAPFNTLYNVSMRLPAGLKHQTGNLETTNDIVNNIVLKVMGVIHAGKKNQTAQTMLKAIGVMGDKTIKADTVFDKNYQYHVPIEPKDPNLGLLTIMEGGKLKGYYVPKNMADSFKYEPIADTNLLLKIFFMYPNKLFKPLFTQLNVGFQTVNFLTRDLMETKKLFNTVMPGKEISLKLFNTVKRELKIWGNLLKYYAKAFPHAKRKAWQQQDKLIQEMIKRNMLIVGNSGKFRFSNKDMDKTGLQLVMETAGYGKESPKIFKNLLKGHLIESAKGVLRFAHNVGEMLEAVPKIASHKFIADMELETHPKITEHWIRTYAGSPNFLKISGEHILSNNIVLFYNAIIRGIERMGAMATGKMIGAPQKGRSAFWWHMLKYPVMFALLNQAIEEGMLGEDAKKQQQKISSYMKSNYFNIPLFKDKKTGKTYHVSISFAESDRIIYALTTYLLDIPTAKDKKSATIDALISGASYTGGLVPSFAPTIEIGGAWATALSGGNPYDYFLNSQVFHKGTEEQADWSIKGPIMLNWTLKKMGILKGDIRDRFYDMSIAEKIIKLTPGLNRWLRISDAGDYESDMVIIKKFQKEEATQIEKFKRRMTDYVQEYWKEKPADVEIFLLSIMRKEKLRDETVSDQKIVDSVTKEFLKILIKGINSAHLNMLSSGSNKQKAVLLADLKTRLSSEDYANLINDAVKQGVINKTVIEETINNLEK
ncbi:hypothetical protein KKH00_03680 [Patescibacteria group bacterium]|nr:hypothetical protein [Patescibacteria group bacterium]